MVKTEVIRKAGIMDEDFFLYAEEAEWCARLRKWGRLVIFGHLQVVHLQGATSNTAFASSGQGYYNLYDRKGLQIMMSNFVRVRKQWGSGWFLFQLVIYTLTVPLMFLGSFLQYLLHRHKHSNAVGPARGFARNVLTAWKHAGTIMKNKPHFYKFL
jgi:GT2 family glycosyltransferase